MVYKKNVFIVDLKVPGKKVEAFNIGEKVPFQVDGNNDFLSF